MNRMFHDSRLRTLLPASAAGAGLFCLYLTGLGTIPLLDPDEPIYGQFVKEMAAGSSWITPHYNGHIWFDKPPLFYWLSLISVKLLGLSEFAVRLPSVVAALGIVLMVYLLARYDFGRRAAVLSSIVVATTLMQILMAHAAATDAIMVFLMTAAFYAYRRWLDAEGRARAAWLAACGAAAGFGMLTKGPLVPLLLCMVFVVHLCWIRQLKRLLSLDLATAVAAALVVGMPWYLAMYELHRDLFVQQFIVQTNLTRFIHPLHKSQGGHPYSHFRSLMVMLLLFLPWSVFLPQATRRFWKEGVGAKLAVSSIVVIVLFFSASSTQNFTYTFPAFPAGAILVGLMFSRAEAGDKQSAWTVKRGFWIGTIVSLLIAAAAVILAGRQFRTAETLVALSCGVFVAASVAALICAVRRPGAVCTSAWLTGAGISAFCILLFVLVGPTAGRVKGSRYLAGQLARMDADRIIVYSLHRPGILYYLKQKPVITEDPVETRQMLSESVPTLVVMGADEESDLREANGREVARYGKLVVLSNAAEYGRAVAATRPYKKAQTQELRLTNSMSSSACANAKPVTVSAHP